MKPLAWLAGQRQSLSRNLTSLRQHRFFKDRLSVAILVSNLIVNGIILLVLLLRVRPTQFPVPVRYSSLVGFDKLGSWIQLYGIGIFSLAVTLANGALAIYGFGRSRIASFFLLSGAFVVAAFSLIISLALTAIV